MTVASTTSATGSLAAHAVCFAAGVRDGLRAAQYYVRDLTNADHSADQDRRHAPFLSRVVARSARLVDRTMSWGARVLIAIFLPRWRELPSPFAPGLMNDVARGIRENSLLHNPSFNSYFFRASIHIAERYSAPPYLILEHRVDAARRDLAQAPDLPASEARFLARILIALVDQGPVARIGAIADNNRFFGQVDPNIAIAAIACVALMFAGEGRPAVPIDVDEFFLVTGALIGPRFDTIADLVARRDEVGLAEELVHIKSLY
jgi:hypothetical protein